MYIGNFEKNAGLNTLPILPNSATICPLAIAHLEIQLTIQSRTYDLIPLVSLASIDSSGLQKTFLSRKGTFASFENIILREKVSC